MKNKAFFFTCLIIISIIIAGCTNSSGKQENATGLPTAENTAIEEQESYLTFTDDLDNEIILEKKPKRIVILAPELLPMLYELGGEAVGRTVSSTPVPSEAEDIQELGTVNDINVEQLIALQPDLVIGSPHFHSKLSDMMKINDIPLVLLKMTTFDDVKEKAELLGEITENGGQVQQLLEQTENEMKLIQERLPKEEKHTAVVLNVTPSSISIQRENTTALEVSGLLGFENLAKDMAASTTSPTSAPFSIEKLVELQPEFIFITVHGAPQKGKESIETNLEGNPAWHSLEAIQNNRTAVLPSNLFLSNPGFHYAESMEYMANLAFPDIVDNGK